VTIRDPAENAVHEGSSLDGGDVTLLAQQELLTDERHEYVSFTVYGDAKPGGSKKAFAHPQTGRIIVVEDSKNKPWRQEVANAGLGVVPVGGAPLFRRGRSAWSSCSTGRVRWRTTARTARSATVPRRTRRPGLTC
jgi:hypothetical protein